MPCSGDQPAVNYVGALCCSLEVVESSDEGEDRVRVVRHPEIWPACVVELLHLSPLCFLERERKRGEDGDWVFQSLAIPHMTVRFESRKYFFSLSV